MNLDEIKKRFQTKRDDLSIYTINIYISCIKKLLELMDTDDISILLTNPDEVIKTLEKHYDNFNSRKTKLGAVLSYMNLLKKTKALENVKSKYLTKICQNQIPKIFQINCIYKVNLILLKVYI